MPVLMNIPYGVHREQLKSLQTSLHNVIPANTVAIKTLSFMFDTSTKTYVYTDASIKSTSVVTVVLGDSSMAKDYGIDYAINILDGNVTFTCESIPQDDLGNAAVSAMVKIVNM